MAMHATLLSVASRAPRDLVDGDVLRRISSRAEVRDAAAAVEAQIIHHARDPEGRPDQAAAALTEALRLADQLAHAGRTLP